MSEDHDHRPRDSDEAGEPDAFDSLDDPAEDITDPFAELGEGLDGDDPEADVNAGAREHSADEPAAPAPETPTDDSDEWDDETPPLDDAFEQMDVGGPAAEDVWELLDADAGVGGATSVSNAGDTEHVVSKRTYCQQCPHFTRPPEFACTHEGTTIVEAVGFDQFRVRNCPMISEEDPTFDGES
ncbi:hypothetical protein [Halorubrum sp. HHNYT27]|uniref:hypothetical protein n=1 Tax=Halorubrum sp. HHNYT27 TaxID=3402275 RepID=UPI003EB71A4E